MLSQEILTHCCSSISGEGLYRGLKAIKQAGIATSRRRISSALSLFRKILADKFASTMPTQLPADLEENIEEDMMDEEEETYSDGENDTEDETDHDLIDSIVGSLF